MCRQSRREWGLPWVMKPRRQSPVLAADYGCTGHGSIYMLEHTLDVPVCFMLRKRAVNEQYLGVKDVGQLLETAAAAAPPHTASLPPPQDNPVISINVAESQHIFNYRCALDAVRKLRSLLLSKGSYTPAILEVDPSSGCSRKLSRSF
jgi:hypothetical protein